MRLSESLQSIGDALEKGAKTLHSRNQLSLRHGAGMTAEEGVYIAEWREGGRRHAMVIEMMKLVQRVPTKYDQREPEGLQRVAQSEAAATPDEGQMATRRCSVT